MPQTSSMAYPIGALLALALTAPGAAFAYDNRDAIRDCESRVRSDYGLIDLRESQAVQLPGEKNYRVEGKTKIDGEKYPWSCEIGGRRVVEVQYHGRRPPRVGSGSSSSRGAGAPEVVPRRSGDLEVRMPSGCTALYDGDGELINRGSSCSSSDRRQAENAVDSYLREQGDGSDRNEYRDDRDDDRRGQSYDRRGNRDEYDDGGRGGYGRSQEGPPPEIIAGGNGEAEAVFKNDCVVYYDPRGHRRDASPRCNGLQIDKADQSMRAYRREQGY